MTKALVLGGITVSVITVAACQHPQDRAPELKTSDMSPSNVISGASISPQNQDNGFGDFTPPTDPCHLIDPDQLKDQGEAPVKPRRFAATGNHIEKCTYRDGNHHTILDLSLTSNADGVANFRDSKLRVIQFGGLDIYVMVDESAKCSAGLLGTDKDLVQFTFTPSDGAVAAAALPSGQTWCDFSAPVIAAAGQKLGWSK